MSYVRGKEGGLSVVGIDRIHKLTVDQVLRMVEEGILLEDERVELLEGVLVEMSPQGPEHAFSTGSLGERLQALYSPEGFVREEKPLRASATSLPEPDVAVIRGSRRDYVGRHPDGRDALLVVEVAATSQDADRRKAALYAAAGVPVYWIVDLEGRRLTTHAGPSGEEYALVRILGEEDEVELPDGRGSWRVGSLLP